MSNNLFAWKTSGSVVVARYLGNFIDPEDGVTVGFDDFVTMIEVDPVKSGFAESVETLTREEFSSRVSQGRMESRIPVCGSGN